MSSSAKGMALTTLLGGLTGAVAVLPLNGYVPAASMQNLMGGSTLNLSAAQTVDGIPQSFPADVTITGLSGQVQNTAALSLVGTTITIQVQLYTAPQGIDTFTAVPGAICTMSPSLTGVIAIGTSMSCTTTGLSIPVPIGSKGVMVMSASATGLTLVNTVSVLGGASLAMQ
jgi:BclB C-terminal domain-containing protein